MKLSPGYKAPRVMRILSLVMAFAIIIQGGIVAASTISCYSMGTTKVSLEKDGCCESGMATTLPSLSEKCCDYKTSTKQIHAHHRDSEKVDNPSSDVPTMIVTATTAVSYLSGLIDRRKPHFAQAPPLTALLDTRILHCRYNL